MPPRNWSWSFGFQLKNYFHFRSNYLYLHPCKVRFANSVASITVEHESHDTIKDIRLGQYATEKYDVS